jgi:hypothetical protein
MDDQALRRPRGGIGFTTWGPLVGPCGHLHLTIDAAEDCLTGDRAIYHASIVKGVVQRGARYQSGVMIRPKL